MFYGKCGAKLLIITMILSLSACALRSVDYAGRYAFPQSLGWNKLKRSEIDTMAQVPWFSSVVSSTDFESYDFYVKTKENGAPGEYEAVFALTVSSKLSKDQKKVLKAELQKAKKYLQKEGSIETAFNRVRNGETVSKRIHGTWWILNSDQTNGELMYTIEHNRRYGLYFYEDTDKTTYAIEAPVDTDTGLLSKSTADSAVSQTKDLFTNTPIESIQSINLKAFGFMKGIGIIWLLNTIINGIFICLAFIL